MTASRRSRLARCVLACAVGAAAVSSAGPTLRAERLATKRFTTADGLAGDFIISVTRDSRGFLWFSTRDGLSRFDGTEFVTHGLADGLPNATINFVLETRAGVHWIATNGGGIARFDPRGAGPAGSRRTGSFTSRLLGTDPTVNRVNVLLEDRRGRLWAGTDNGLLRADGADAPFVPIPLPRLPEDASFHGVSDLVEDREGSLWISGGVGLLRLLPDDRFVNYQVDAPRSRASVSAIAFDRDGRSWFGTRGGVLVLDHEPAAAFPPGDAPVLRRIVRVPAREYDVRRAVRDANSRAARWYTRADGLADDSVTEILVSPGTGPIWLGHEAGLTRYDAGMFRGFGAAQGVPEEQVTGLATDVAGNLWVATVAGATRLVPDGLVTFDRLDGLSPGVVRSLYLDRQRRLIAITNDYLINLFSGDRFDVIVPSAPRDAVCTWMSPCLYLDPADRWWMASGLGLFHWNETRTEALPRTAPPLLFDSRHGLHENNVFNVYTDRQRRLWIGTAQGRLAMRLPDEARFRLFSRDDGLPHAGTVDARANAFTEDRAGSVWIGFANRGVARWRDGRFETFGAEAGVPPGSVTALLVDAAGRLWIATNQGGLGRVDDPTAAVPRAVALTEATGLASSNVRCLVEDAYGRVYAGTSRGIDRIAPETGEIRHFGVGEGLASDFVTAAIRGADGHLWFGTVGGMSRLAPEPEPPGESDGAAVPVYIDRILIGGQPTPVSSLGDPAPAALTLSPGQSQVEIGYFGLSFGAGAAPRYQYRLSADEPWSAPTTARSVNYARLAAGDYLFEVRAAVPNGMRAPAAAFRFTVLPPVYRRWWFILGVVAALAVAAAMIARARVNRLVGIERVRARIATDLHDDIGSSLSQIAILAEVARARVVHDEAVAEAVEPLDRIAETSRTLVDSMSDIVWAINPRVDALSDLVHRMRRFVEDTLGSADIEVTFTAPPADAADPKIGADVRREVFLILKESVTNIARHARASRVDIALTIDRRHLRLRVADDGAGFDPAANTDGNGVASMRRRVAALGGVLTIDTAPGRGTRIELAVDWTAPRSYAHA